MTFHSLRPVLACLALLGLTSPLAAQDDGKVVVVPAHGLQVFGHLLHFHGLKPITELERLRNTSPEETVIVAMGELKLEALHALFESGLDGFLKEGGALLIASGHPDRGGLRPWNLEIAGWKVRQRKDSSYQGQYEECPMIVEGLRTNHPLFRGLKGGIATNRPSFLRDRDSDLLTLAEFSSDTSFDMGKGFRIPSLARPAFLCGSPSDAPPAGRIVILSGEGVFINSMITTHDNDNFNFAWNTIKWLREGPKGDRRYAFFVEDGRPVADFALPLTMDMPPLHPELVMRIINRMLADMDKENAFNNMLLEGLGHARAWRVVWISLAAVLCVLMIRRLVQSRFRLETLVPRVVSRTPPAPPLPLEWQRRQALEKLDNYWEPAQALVREFFQKHAGQAAPLWDEPDIIEPPRVQAEGGWWARTRFKHRIRGLWRLAQTPPARRLSRRAFQAMLQTLKELEDVVNAGRLRFVRI